MRFVRTANWQGLRHRSRSDTSTAIFVKTAPEAKIIGPSTETYVIETKSEVELSSSGTTSALLPLSVIIPVRNEAPNLPRCLASLKAAGEVYVIDSQSTDDTAAIAESQGAKVVQFHYAGGWPKKRQWAMDTLPLAYDWILLLDADEVLTPELVEEIRRAIQDPRTDGYYIALQMYFLGRQLRHSGASFWKLSLFRRGLGRYECRLQDQDASMADMEVHEHVVVNGATRKLTYPLIHHNVESLFRYIQKHNEYSNWEAHVWLDGNRNAAEIQPSFWGTQAQRRRWLRLHLLGVPGSPILFFLYKYVLRLGFLDGVPGLIYCVMQGIQFFHIKAKIYELKSDRKSDRKNGRS
jgi:glycosyltransferase involved in cell wall biosynthesis